MKKINFKQTGTAAAGLVAGSILANLLVNKLPASVSNPKLRAAVPLVAGVLLSMQKNDMVKFAGYGMIANGGSKLLGSVVPQLAGVTGVGDEMFGFGDEMLNGFGDEMISDDMSGINEEMYGIGDGVLNGIGEEIYGLGDGVLNGFSGSGDGNDN